MIYFYIALGIVGLYLIITLGIFFFIFYRPKQLDFTTLKGFPYKELISDGLKVIKSKTYKEVSINSFDNVKLVGYLFETNNAVATIILIHGYSSYGFQDFGSVFEIYQGFGYNILIIAQRAHTTSGGHFCTYGIKESKDIQKWVEFVNNTYPNLPIRFSGISLGSSTALFATNLNLPNVISIIADSGFTSPYEEIKHVAKTVAHIPPFLFIGIIQFYAKLFLKIDIKQSALNEVNKTTIPILFIHGRADNFVPFWMGEKLFEACASKKVNIFVNGATHGNSFFKDPETVKEVIVKFFEETTPKN